MTLEQFKDWVDETFPDNTARLITEANFRDALKSMAEFVTTTNSSDFIQRTIEEVAAMKDASAVSAGLAADERTLAAGVKQQMMTQAADYLNTFQALISQGFVPKGSWNISTNTPNLASIAKSVNDAWVVDADGTTSITGTSLQMKKNDAVQWNGSAFIWRPAAMVPGDKSVTPGKTSFVETDDDGNFIIRDLLSNIGLILTKTATLKTARHETGQLSLGGSEINPADLLFKSAVANQVFQAMQLYVQGKMRISTDDASIFRAEDSDGNIGFHVTADSKLLVKTIEVQDLKVKGTAEINGMSGAKYPKSKWVGKTIHWLGTSIPHYGLYPGLSSDQNGATVINKALGSSSARAAKADGSITGIAWQTYTRALTHTIAQKQNIIANWATIRTSLTGSPPDLLSEAEQGIILGASYENALLPYLDGTFPMPDLFVFDHGYNDRPAGFGETDAAFTAFPAIRNDKNTFLGAANFIFDLIFQYNNHARIAMIGHYQNTSATVVSVAQAQTALAAAWSVPFLKLWEKTGWSSQLVPGSVALWTQPPYNAYSSGQNTSQDMSLIRTWLPDGLHPHTDTSNRAQNLLGDIVGAFLSDIF